MKNTTPNKLITISAISGLVAAFFALLIMVFNREEKKRINTESLALLEAVTASKKANLTHWMSDEINDVKLIIQNANLIELSHRFVKGDDDESILVDVFNQIKSEHDYAELVLLSETGDYLTSTNQALTFNDSIDQQMLVMAFATDSCYVSDIYRSSIDNRVYIDLVSILRNDYGKAFAGIIFKIYAEETVDQLLSDWQMVGYRGIVSLIQQLPDEKWIMYKPDSLLVTNHALWKPLPMRLRNDPFNPHNKLTRVIDLPNTSWSLMVEMDNSKRKAAISVSITMVSIISVISVLIFFFSVFILANYQEKRYLIKLKERESDLDRMKNQFWFTMDLLSEAIVLTDENGLIQYMNLSAELQSGWKLEEVEGKLLEKQIPLLQEESGMPLLSIRNWFSGERAYNQNIASYLVDKSGVHKRVICSLAHLQGENHEIKGLVVVLVKGTEKQSAASVMTETTN